MKLKGTPNILYEQIGEYLDKQKQDQELVCFISKTETKEMILHTQRKMLRGLCSEIAKYMGEDAERVKQIFLIGCFGSKEMQMGKFKTEVAIKPTTSELTKQETIFYINALWKFICDRNIPCKYTPREVQSLIDSYN